MTVPIVAEMTSVEAKLLASEVAGLRGDVGRMDSKLETITDALVKLTALEADHANTRRAIERAFEQIKENADRSRVLDDRIHAVERALPQQLSDRIGRIEVVLPGLIEARKWVVTLCLGAVTLLLVAVAGLVLNKPAVISVSPVTPQVAK